jgi:predicted lipoprotein with Yx(FWY)xxD motif
MRQTLGVLATCMSIGVAAGCGNDESSSDAAAKPAGDRQTSSENAPDQASSAGARVDEARRRGSAVKVMRSNYGRILFDGKGRALYLFTRESSRRSRCYGACAAAWPPFLTKGAPRARSGAQSTLLGTTRRRDGKRQVTYAGHPLYYYVGDRKPGQVLCQNVEEFGGTWLVVEPSGAAVR